LVSVGTDLRQNGTYVASSLCYVLFYFFFKVLLLALYRTFMHAESKMLT